MSEKDRILKEVGAALELEPRIDLHHYPVRIYFNDATLTLEGVMENVAAKKLALELGVSVTGVTGIIDRLKVAPSATMTDAEIRDHLCNALGGDSSFGQCAIRREIDGQVELVREPPGEKLGDIQVIVDDGKVLLEGQAPSLSHKCLAGVLHGGRRAVRTYSTVLKSFRPRKTTMMKSLMRSAWFLKRTARCRWSYERDENKPGTMSIEREPDPPIIDKPWQYDIAELRYHVDPADWRASFIDLHLRSAEVGGRGLLGRRILRLNQAFLRRPAESAFWISASQSWIHPRNWQVARSKNRGRRIPTSSAM